VNVLNTRETHLPQLYRRVLSLSLTLYQYFILKVEPLAPNARVNNSGATAVAVAMSDYGEREKVKRSIERRRRENKNTMFKWKG